MDIIKKIERENMRMDVPAFRSGDTVKVHLRIVEGEKQRIQVFQGNVIRIKRGTTNATFTVRKVSDGVGVERIFPMNSPFIDRVELVTQGCVPSRAKPRASSRVAASDSLLRHQNTQRAFLTARREMAGNRAHGAPLARLLPESP